MNAVERNIDRYLEIEGILNVFFAAFDFCPAQCIAPERANNHGQPVAACCRDKYYTVFDLEHDAFDRLRQERERLYGAPANHFRNHSVSPCEYHNPQTGCLLKSHKSPVCLAFFCRKAIDRLRTRFGIYFYDYLGMHYALEWILTGVLADKDYRDLKTNLIEAAAKINSAKNPGLKP
jgi:hypothetical protein